jgi:glycine C-acetyltransferase
MLGKMKNALIEELKELKKQGLYKKERIIITPQGSEITVSSGKKVLNFCSNNYLGFSNHPDVIKAAKEAMDRWGFGLSSVRFICGTQSRFSHYSDKNSHINPDNFPIVTLSID